MRPNCKNERWTNSQGMKTSFLKAYLTTSEPSVHSDLLFMKLYKKIVGLNRPNALPSLVLFVITKFIINLTPIHYLELLALQITSCA
jgi:hypothetical protein